MAAPARPRPDRPDRPDRHGSPGPDRPGATQRSNAARRSESPQHQGAQQATLREHNLGLVARTVLEAPAPPSRADVAALTGLTRATVSRLVDTLLAAGVLAELPPVASRTAGRPAVPLVPARRTLAALGLEVNVDYIGGLVVDLAGDVLDDRVDLADLHDSDPAAVLGRLGALARDLADGARASRCRIVGAGLALPGIVDADDGLLRVAPNLGWREVTARDLLDGAGGLLDPAGPGLMVGNEADLAAVAEAALMREVPAAERTFLYVSGEIGVGAAIVLRGELLRGVHGWGGELGHVLVDPGGPPCRCGARGCLETYAGTSAMLRAAGLDAGPRALVGAPGLAELERAAEAGEPRAVAAVERAGRALGSALGDAVNLLDITTIVLGNRYAPLAPLLTPVLGKALVARALSAPWAPPQIRPAAAGELAAMTGAARQVLDGVVSDPAAWLARGTLS